MVPSIAAVVNTGPIENGIYIATIIHYHNTCSSYMDIFQLLMYNYNIILIPVQILKQKPVLRVHVLVSVCSQAL